MPHATCFAESCLKLGLLVAQGTCPVAEWYTAVHASGCLQLAVMSVERLLHFAKVGYALVYRAVASFLSLYLKE